jgi:4-hydroxyphenylpyruvate dioxygenase-like putative hemolysin
VNRNNPAEGGAPLHLPPAFFIERKEGEAFGEGNFGALFRSTEAGQLRGEALRVDKKVED